MIQLLQVHSSISSTTRPILQLWRVGGACLWLEKLGLVLQRPDTPLRFLTNNQVRQHHARVSSSLPRSHRLNYPQTLNHGRESK
jgi:hypothetical protein